MNSEALALGLTEDPIEAVLRWLKEAEAAGAPEPTAMTVATATRDGVPSARIVLFKGLSTFSDGRRAPQFYTNYESRKSAELSANPRASLVFFWPQLSRQVRIEGKIEKVSPEDSNAYFQSRPRGSRIGAWASPQSRKIATRADLLRLVDEVEKRFESSEIPCPPNWGGWHVVPERIEFWQAGEFRLHDRFLYEWDGRTWSVSRLAP